LEDVYTLDDARTKQLIISEYILRTVHRTKISS